ncbi:DsbA family protein [Paenibacillus sp. CAA11]|uniref:DsbA family protein n=1 Tax=Paenibacillus sp. CAA11 TaxID=1532905 RepID=UPI001F369A6D|nr:DsbA family protein [Paenibacillus sp. CAA11]
MLLQPKSENKVDFAYDQLPVLGNPNAPVKIVEYGDYQCPYCRTFNQEVKPELKSYIDEGKVAFYFSDFLVIENAPGDSNRAALAARSVYHQNKDAFWQFHDALYRDQGQEESGWITTDFLVNLAKSEKLDIDYDLLRKDIENKTYQNEVDEQNEFASKQKLEGTPSLFINGKEQAYPDFMKPDNVKKAIDEAVKGS